MVLLGNVLCLFPTKISPLFEYVLKMSKERQEVQLVKAWQKQDLSVFVPTEQDTSDQELGSCKNHTRSRDETRPRILRDSVALLPIGSRIHVNESRN